MGWIKKGVILGSVFFIAIFLVRPVGVSTQYSVLSGIIHKTFNTGIIWEDKDSESGYASSNDYYNANGGKIAREIEHPWSYEFVFVLAIPLGGLVGTLFYKNKRRKKGYEIKEYNIIKIYGPSFISGFLLLYGARMADGCTSGHMMSGIMQGSLSGYLFAISVFAVAIPTAIIFGKIRKV